METEYMKFKVIAEMLKVLAHPVRLCIVKSLLLQGECNVGHMYTCMELPQSTVSQHLQKLKFAGIIEGKRSGVEIKYKLKDERTIRLVKSILDLCE